MNPSLNHNYSNLHRIGNENCQLTLQKILRWVGNRTQNAEIRCWHSTNWAIAHLKSLATFSNYIFVSDNSLNKTNWQLPYAWIRIVLSSGGLASLKPSWQGLRMAKPYTRSKILMHYGVPEQSLTTVWTVNIKKLHAEIHKETSTATQKFMY